MKTQPIQQLWTEFIVFALIQSVIERLALVEDHAALVAVVVATENLKAERAATRGNN